MKNLLIAALVVSPFVFACSATASPNCDDWEKRNATPITAGDDWEQRNAAPMPTNNQAAATATPCAPTPPQSATK